MRLLLLLIALTLGAGCSENTSEDVAPEQRLSPLAFEPPYPPDNLENQDRFLLGWRLFYDPILSGGKDVACGTCHHPSYGMSDGRDVSLGIKATGLGPTRKSIDSSIGRVSRNALSILNTAYMPHFFWDGRVHSLEEQALIPIASHKEMRGDAFSEFVAIDSILARLRKIALYERDFRNAFSETKDSVLRGIIPSAITRSTMARAIAAFERKLITPYSKFDGYLRGDSLFTQNEKEGLNLFIGKAGCIRCHSGPMLSDFQYYSQGIGNLYEIDQGRSQVSRDPADAYTFRTPTLRNVSKTGPYMHSGVMGTLREVIEYYNTARPHDAQQGQLISSMFQILGLTEEEKHQLEQFLLTLTDESWQPFAELPASVYSGLPVPHR
jgi:cytochrome c peroxidase